jgi:hypothetical protein
MEEARYSILLMLFPGPRSGHENGWKVVPPHFPAEIPKLKEAMEQVVCGSPANPRHGMPIQESLNVLYGYFTERQIAHEPAK